MPAQPNILLLLGEQHRGDCLSGAGHPVLLTPTLDWIGAGTRFSAAYSTGPVCVPARRSLISGQSPQTHGTVNNALPDWDPVHTLASTLGEAGYQTAWVGRSMHQKPVDNPMGFDEYIYMDHRAEDHYDAYLKRNMPEGYGGYYGSGVMHNDWTARPFHMPENLHHTNWTVHEAQQFLDRRDPAKPFFLVVSFLAAHPPLIPPACYFDRYIRTGVPDPVIGDWAEPPAQHTVGVGATGRQVDLTGEALLSARAGYYGLINHMDDQIRRLVNGVDGGVPMNDTAVIYTADHGEMLGDHYQWRKSVPFEGSAHIPMLIRGPSAMNLPAHQVCDAPACLEDIMPTVLEMAGVPIPETVEGHSLLPLLRGETPEWRDAVHIQTGDGGPGALGNAHCLTDGREKYIRYDAGGELFFDLMHDPEERHNALHDPGMEGRIDGWRERLNTWSP
ncbi:MAG: sulfatase-like hydrolase/transferase [Planctomycetota bacterium]|jgi:arylsulfatase A-like enzyme